MNGLGPRGTRIVERDLTEHVRQENAAYREIARKRMEQEARDGRDA